MKKRTNKRRSTSSMYHFAYFKVLSNNDGRLIHTGDTHTVSHFEGVCAVGLHASPTPRQAWCYVPGSVLSHVRLHGTKQWCSSGNKAAASKRTYLKSVRLDSIQFAQLRDVGRRESSAVFNRLAKKFLKQNPAI